MYPTTQHPYRGTFPDITVNIPLEEGSHVIRVETSANAAENTGFDDVAVTLAKVEIPGSESGGGDTLLSEVPGTSGIGKSLGMCWLWRRCAF
ncbi:MAG: hypothetical protein HQ559_08430, partial [Lentisphaerae bacterium]|nr:hypothetical protein [Lentisphaerota bacterium]